MRKIAAANWKMFKTPEEARSFLKDLASKFPKSPSCDVVIFPPSLTAETVAAGTKDTFLKWGGQNSHFEKQGAFTGENSPWTLASLGADFVLVGHSERRALFGEKDDLLAKKVKAAQEAGLTPMLCVGETLAERDSGKTAAVITHQLKAGLLGCDLLKPLTIAYEPVWAIGTGRVATPEQASEAHEILKQTLRELGAPASEIPVLYGGSVKPDNAAKLAAQPGIDGFLVGGASLEPGSFHQIISALTERA